MSERPVLIIQCSKAKDPPHIVGRAYAATEGFRLDWTASVYGVGGYVSTGAPASALIVRGEATSSQAWCKTCRKALPFGTDELLRAIDARKPTVRLAALGMHLDPIGVLDRKRKSTEG